MKYLFTVLAFLILGSAFYAQTIPSSCTASESVEMLYMDDAQRLTMRKFLDENSIYLDSIHIPQNHTDTILKALIAVYNAVGLPARDTVVDMYNVHTLNIPTLNMLFLEASKTLWWMDSLQNNNIPTGNFYIDSLISAHALNLTGYYEFGNLFSYHHASFVSDSNYNLFALAEAFMEEPLVFGAGLNALVFDGGDITSSIFPDHVELTYSIAWGDCLSGCIYSRFWKFKVYFDCSVEYVGSYGSLITNLGMEEQVDGANIHVHPNPIQDEFFIANISEPVVLEIYNPMGQLIFSDKSYAGSAISIENQLSGIYVVRISTELFTTSKKFVKL